MQSLIRTSFPQDVVQCLQQSFSNVAYVTPQFSLPRFDTFVNPLDDVPNTGSGQPHTLIIHWSSYSVVFIQPGYCCFSSSHNCQEWSLLYWLSTSCIERLLLPPHLSWAVLVTNQVGLCVAHGEMVITCNRIVLTLFLFTHQAVLSVFIVHSHHTYDLSLPAVCLRHAMVVPAGCGLPSTAVSLHDVVYVAPQFSLLWPNPFLNPLQMPSLITLHPDVPSSHLTNYIWWLPCPLSYTHISFLLSAQWSTRLKVLSFSVPCHPTTLICILSLIVHQMILTTPAPCTKWMRNVCTNHTHSCLQHNPCMSTCPYPTAHSCLEWSVSDSCPPQPASSSLSFLPAAHLSWCKWPDDTYCHVILSEIRVILY